MHKRSVRPAVFLAAVAMAGGALAGCADNRSTFFIREAKVPSSGECTLAPANPYISRGVMDSLVTERYVLSLSLVNQSFDRSEMMPGQLDNGGINVEGAEVELHLDAPDGPVLDITGTGQQTAFTVYGTGFVPSAMSGTASEAVVSFEVIPPVFGLQLRDMLATASVPTQTVLVGITVFGRNGGGYVQETPQFFFPVDICYGCLITFPPEADDTEIPGTICDSVEAVDDAACSVGQDQAVDCRLCRDSGRPELRDICNR